MPANPNWARWIFASIADTLRSVATAQNLAVLVEHFDERSDAFMQAADRAEIRITGPFTKEQSKGYHRVLVDVNVLLTSRYDGRRKNAYDIHKYAGLFHERMTQPIPIWNYGNEPGDYGDTPLNIGCLITRDGNNDNIRVFHFGQTDKIDKIKQSAVDARYEMYLYE